VIDWLKPRLLFMEIIIVIPKYRDEVECDSYVFCLFSIVYYQVYGE